LCGNAIERCVVLGIYQNPLVKIQHRKPIWIAGQGASCPDRERLQTSSGLRQSDSDFMANKNTMRHRRENPSVFQKRKSIKPKVAAAGGGGMTLAEQRAKFYGITS
jgi:hypothetical protein